MHTAASPHPRLNQAIDSVLQNVAGCGSSPATSAFSAKTANLPPQFATRLHQTAPNPAAAATPLPHSATSGCGSPFGQPSSTADPSRSTAAGEAGSLSARKDCHTATSLQPPQDLCRLPPALAELSPQQLQALDHLSQGKSVSETARLINVARNTVSRWCNHHPGFVAELNRRQQEAIACSTTNYQHLLTQAIEIVAKTLNGSDDAQALRTALSILNGPAARKLIAPSTGPGTELGALTQILSRDVQPNLPLPADHQIRDLLLRLHQASAST